MRGRGAALRVVGQPAARAGIGAPRVAMRRGQRGGDVGAGAEAGINEPVGAQPVERGGIVRDALRLDQRRRVGRDPEPRQILHDPRDEFGAAAAGVEILDPQQETLPRRAREHRAIGVAKVEAARRRGSETRRSHGLLLTANRGSTIHDAVTSAWHPGGHKGRRAMRLLHLACDGARGRCSARPNIGGLRVACTTPTSSATRILFAPNRAVMSRPARHSSSTPITRR